MLFCTSQYAMPTVSPYKAVVVPVNVKDETQLNLAEKITKELEDAGVEVICRSDWGGLRRVHYLHKMAKNEKDAIYLSKKNGLDCQGGNESEYVATTMLIM